MRFILLLFAASSILAAAEPDWPQFRGPALNPVGTGKRLPDRWSKTENIEWTAEVPGRGWSSPIVTGGKVYLTTATTEGKSKPPQIGTEYSNEYAAELKKQGLGMEEILKRVIERDMEMPHEVMLHYWLPRYWLYCLDLDSGPSATHVRLTIHPCRRNPSTATAEPASHKVLASGTDVGDAVTKARTGSTAERAGSSPASQ